MSIIKSWNYRWFGLWKESRPEFSKYPSIKEFITESKLDAVELEKVVNYLNNGVVIATTSRRSFPCVITGKRFTGSLSQRTDGTWLWNDDLSYYIREFGVSLPEKMIEHIRNNKYVIPLVSQDQINSLEHPS